MAGSSLLLKPLPDFVAEFAYGKFTEILGISKDPESNQIEQLKALPAQELVAKADPSIPLLPIIDGDLIQSPASFSQWSEADIKSKLPGTSWVKRAMFGDCQFDVGVKRARATF